jgi:hypothetical protein
MIKQSNPTCKSLPSRLIPFQAKSQVAIHPYAAKTPKPASRPDPPPTPVPLRDLVSLHNLQTTNGGFDAEEDHYSIPHNLPSLDQQPPLHRSGDGLPVNGLWLFEKGGPAESLDFVE